MKKTYKTLLFTAIVCSYVQAEKAVESVQKQTVKKKSAQKFEPVKPQVAKTGKCTLVDKIVATIHVEPHALVITQKEVEMPSLGGQKRTLEDIIFERLVAYEAEYKYKVPNSEESAQKYFEMIKKQNNVSDEDLNRMFEQQGRTYKEAFEEYRAMTLAQQMIAFKIQTRVVIPEEDVKEYYDKNPVYEDAAFKLKRGFISHDAITQEQLEAFQKYGDYSYKVEWTDPYWIKESELAPSRAFIKNMEAGDTSKVETVPGGYEVVQVVQKRLAHKKTFEEARADIIHTLQGPYMQQKLEEYKKELFSTYEIVYR